MHKKKHLSFTALRKALSEHFGQVDDRRQDGKVVYRLHDCLMSGFAMMFFQDPSLLAFQRRMQDSIQVNTPEQGVCRIGYPVRHPDQGRS